MSELLARWHRWRAPVPIALIGYLGAWSGLFAIKGVLEWGYGPRTFAMLMGLLLLLVLGTRGKREFRNSSQEKLAVVTLAVVAVLLASRLGGGFVEELKRPENEHWIIDIAANTYLAGSAFLAGKNPYAVPVYAEVYQRVRRGPHVTVEHGNILMYGLPYRYGYPYFPAMFLSYLPGRLLVQGYDSIRAVNALLLLLDLVGVFWLARRLATHSTVGGLAACVAFLGIPFLQQELFHHGVTDFLIGTYALYAFVALTYRQFVLTGVLLGIAQACKLLPGPLIAIPVLVWLWRKEGFWRFTGAYVLASLVLILPFVLESPALFLTSTTLFYVTHLAAGDDTSLWFFLPNAIKPLFRFTGCVLAVGCAAVPLWRRDTDELLPTACAFASYVFFMAFNNMTHLNYMWGVYTLGCAALAAHSLRGLSLPRTPSGSILNHSEISGGSTS